MMSGNSDEATAAGSGTIEWAESIVGRDCEVYWSNDGDDDDDAVLAEASSSGAAAESGDGDDAKKKNDNEKEEAEGNRQRAAAAAAAAAAAKESGNDDTQQQPQPMEVAEDGDEPNTGRDNNEENNNKEKDDGSGEDGSEEEEEHEADWYDATIISLVKEGEGDGGGGGASSFTFKVAFAGDDEVCEMELRPEVVRPSARAWMRRAKAILRREKAGGAYDDDDDSANVEAWMASLPHDTRTLSDAQTLDAVRSNFGGGEGVLPDEPLIAASNPSLIPSTSKIQDIRNLAILTKSQITLRSKLAPASSNQQEEEEQQRGDGNNEDDDHDDDQGPTEDELNFMVDCLRRLEAGCEWFLRCWSLHSSIFFSADDDGASPVVEEEEEEEEGHSISQGALLKDYLDAGRRTITEMVTTDLSYSGSKKRKRGRTQQSSSSSPSQRVTTTTTTQRLSPTSEQATAPANNTPTRRTKRRRKNKGYVGFQNDDGTNTNTVMDYENLDDDEFLSAEVVDKFAETVRATDTRWYCRYFASMLRSLSTNVVTPFVKWKRRVEFYLGETAVWGDSTKASSDERSEDEDMDVDEDRSDDGRTLQRYATYEEIKSALEVTEADAVLKRVNVTDFVLRLEQKLAGIESFASELEKLIGATLDDGDHISRDLKRLLDTARSKDSAVANVEPFGRSTSLLTRMMIENAIEYRCWYLDLKRAETTRERVQLVEDVVSKFNDLPPLPTSLEGIDMSTKTALVAPRAKALSEKLASFTDSVARYDGMLENPNGHEELATVEAVVAALNNLRQMPYASLAEEMLAIRKDVFNWSSEVKPTLEESAKPAFRSILDIKKRSDLILEGKSPTRSAVIRNIKDNPNVNARVRDYARSQMISIAGDLRDKVESIYAVASAWKDRAESIVNALRQFGNPIAGEHLSSSRLPVMVDLKRIEALISSEYVALPVKLDDLYDVLSRVYSESIEWSSRMTTHLLDDSKDFKDCLTLVQGVGRERPKGIIVDPNRQVVDMLDELLSWYMTVKSSAGADSTTLEVVNQLLLEGLEVLERFSQNRGKEEDHPFIVRPAQAIPLVTKSRGSARILPRAKLELSSYGRKILADMVDADRDSREGHPLLILLHFLWLITVDNFNTRCLSNTTERGDLSLVEAKRLLNSRPLPSAIEPSDANSEQNSPFTRIGGDHIAKLKELIRAADEKEEKARGALSRSKSLLRESLNKPEEVHQLLDLLKDLQGEFKNLFRDGVGRLALDQKIEHQLDHGIKLFSWLDKAYQYRVLRTREIDDDCDFGEDEKVPWDVLVWLCDRIPQTSSEGVDFDYVLLRVKELREAATAWQEEISQFTMLSLRGGKRRKTNEDPGSNVTEEDESNQIDLKKVAELSHNPILSKVTMPREGAIRQMLENTNKFEAQLHQLLGTDFVGVNSDWVYQYPEAGSLVGKDGSFLLYRLTESPLFEALKATLALISETAGDVFAETPGKATFDWICQAVSWIESLMDSVTRLPSPPPLSREQKGRLIIPCSEARKLLSSGDEIFLNVPDDLRRTLSKYKIYVSSNKLTGKLTVKSKKGGAHHSPGVTVVCWCPLLFDSLRADSQRLESWQRSVTGVAATFTSYMQQAPASEEDFLLRFHGFQEEVSDLLVQLQDMVVYPSPSLIDSTQRLLAGIDSRLRATSAETYRKYATTKYKNPAAVVSNRFLLLDSLMNRRSNDPQVEIPSLTGASKEVSFRTALKSLLKQALRKGLSTIGLSPESEEASSLCALKAWEIEYKLFELFQGELGESKMSSEYRERGRALKRSLEDTDNVAFCVRVLTGQIKTDALVRMSSEDLANPKTKEERAKAAVAAEQSSVLTGVANSNQSKQTPESGSSESKKVSVVQGVKVSSPMQVTSKGKTNAESKSTATPPSMTSTPGSPVRSPSFTLGDFAKAGRPSLPPPPPPPPSLAASIRSSQSTATESEPDIMVTNSSGGQHFLVTLGSRTFSASFYAESDPDSSLIDGLLPEELIEKGRLRIEEFTKFLTTKVGGGRWAAAPLRLATYSDKHAREYRKFYKDYESRQRIAMVPLQREAKLFLVTPKFHRAAKGITMSNPSSTYAVVLTRK